MMLKQQFAYMALGLWLEAEQGLFKILYIADYPGFQMIFRNYFLAQIFHGIRLRGEQ